MNLLKRVIVILFVLIATTGCSEQKPLNELVDSNNIKEIELHRQSVVKISTNTDDIKQLFSLLKDVHYEKAHKQGDINGWSYFINFYNGEGSKSTMSFISNQVQYKGIWYDLDDNIIDEISKYFDSLPSS